MSIIMSAPMTATNWEALLQPKENSINVLELTLLLKTMGFRLNYLDYEDPKDVSTSTSGSKELTIEIRCGHRNIVSRLSASEDQCACPAKREETDNDSSFWEILGTAPSSSPGRKKIEETSSNLLPDLSKRGVAHTKKLLGLIFEGFHKDHLPTSTTTTNSPEQRPAIPAQSIHTSTQLKSPRRQIPVLDTDDEQPTLPYHDLGNVLTAPPNTPKVQTSAGLDVFKAARAKNARQRDHLVFLEISAAKERLDKALLAMKLNIAGDMSDLHGPPLDLCTNHKIFEEGSSHPETLSNGQSPSTFQRRSSMGSFPNLKPKPTIGDKKGLIRNKSSIDTGAASKAKTGAVTSRYLLPKKPTTSTDAKKVSPLAKKSVAGKASTAKRSPGVGVGWK